ncbi:hypothetical protein [Streptomyces mexicanus]|jgi:hypothetical protein|uniref:hypothetical protein n=1 Tax=Streptomyces mexicanus TaxID=178566 RepID=UPI0031EA5D30
MSGHSGLNGQDRLEDVLREALAARADTVGAGDLRPARPPSSSGVPRRHRLRPAVLTALGLAAAIAAAVFLVNGASHRSHDPSVVPSVPSVSPDGSTGPTTSPSAEPAAPAPAPSPSGNADERPGPGLTGAAPR